MSPEELNISQFTPPLTGYQRGDAVFINGERYIFTSVTTLAPDRRNGRQPRNRHERRKARKVKS